jgi:hypothetical protein
MRLLVFSLVFLTWTLALKAAERTLELTVVSYTQRLDGSDFQNLQSWRSLIQKSGTILENEHTKTLLKQSWG